MRGHLQVCPRARNVIHAVFLRPSNLPCRSRWAVLLAIGWAERELARPASTPRFYWSGPTPHFNTPLGGDQGRPMNRASEEPRSADEIGPMPVADTGQVNLCC